ncbi:MAG: hypothetical protein AB4038_10690 [Prochloraceae cyanobacterium]
MRREIEDYLETKLRLKIHPIKSQIFETKYGANFLGFRVVPDRRRARLRLKQMEKDYAQGKLSLEKLIQRLQSWEAHLVHGDTYRLRHQIFNHWLFSRLNL